MIQSYEIVVTLIIFYYQDWVQDKIRSKFAFAAMCWERSFIPLSIWKAGDSNSNLIESVHADVNCERSSMYTCQWNQERTGLWHNEDENLEGEISS